MRWNETSEHENKKIEREEEWTENIFGKLHALRGVAGSNELAAHIAKSTIGTWYCNAPMINVIQWLALRSFSMQNAGALSCLLACGLVNSFWCGEGYARVVSMSFFLRFFCFSFLRSERKMCARTRVRTSSAGAAHSRYIECEVIVCAQSERQKKKKFNSAEYIVHNRIEQPLHLFGSVCVCSST